MRRNQHTFRRYTQLASACIAVLAAAGAVTAALPVEKKPAIRLFAAGNDRALWLIVGRWDEQEKTYCSSFAMMDATSTQARVVASIIPQKGTIECVAAIGNELSVFYGPDAAFNEDGAHYRYDRGGGGRAMSLPGAVMPAAIAGESAGDPPRLWAVVPSSTAGAVRTDWEKQQLATSRPADAIASGEPAGESRPSVAVPRAETTTAQVLSESYHLVQYDGARWRPGFPAPDACGASERVWLAPTPNRFHLFWQTALTDTRIHYAWHENDTWTIGPSLTLDAPPINALATVINANLIFGTLHRKSPADAMFQVRLWKWQSGGSTTGAEPGGSWSRLPNLEISAGEELVLPAEATLSAFVDKLAVLRSTDKPAEFAFYAPMSGGPPSQSFQEIPQIGTNTLSRAQRNLRELIATLVVAALLLLVFWRRQESLATSIPLPAGVGIAGPAKRAAAAIVDMLPAVILAGSIWYVPIRTFALESRAAMLAGQSEGVPVPDAVIFAWFCYVIVYTIWCTVFEIFWQTTPGKRLLGCEVRQESFERANTIQIIIRNMTKVLELLPYLQIWPFMLVVFLTRNHQRLGDLLARTVVIERQHIVSGGDD